MPGRRWSDGLHQAVEAKEKVKIERENQTLATITFQNYFRMYKKLSGMTGTAETEAPEFDKIYKLEVLAIPTNRPAHPRREPGRRLPHRAREVRRGGRGDQGAATRPAARCWWAPSPSRSPSTSRRCSRSDGIKHVVLNAKYHEREAEIVAQAGRFGAVTIATNMAGRGTDIILGGVPDHRIEGDPASSRSSTRSRPRPRSRRPAARPDRARRWRATSRRRSRSRRSPPEERSDAGQALRRHPGRLRRRPPVGAGRWTASRREFPALRAYLEWRAPCPAPTKEKIARSFYPQGEEPVDFLAVHPLKARPRPDGRRPPEFAQHRGVPRPERARARGGPGRPAHPGHRAPRGAPHRQPAARPRRPPGRPRLVALLPLARRRPHAHLRLRPHQRPDAEAGHGRGRAHRARDGHEVDRARAEAGGGAELRRPQAPARVRRRDEQAAQGRLRHAPHDPRGQGHPRLRPEPRRGGPRLVPRQLRRARARTPTSGTWRGCSSRSRRPSASTSPSTSSQTHGPRRDGRRRFAERIEAHVRGEGAAGRPRADALPRAHDHAADRGHAVEGPPATRSTT